MLLHSVFRLFALTGASFLFIATAPAWAVNAQIGILKCDTSTGIGEIIERKQTMNCVFTRTDGTTENYTGSIHEFGIELGEVKEGHLIWAVVSGSTAKDNGLLTGKYDGVDAEAAVGLGVGADALLGGTEKAFALQPLAVEGETGINIAAGVEQIELTAGK